MFPRHRNAATRGVAPLLVSLLVVGFAVVFVVAATPTPGARAWPPIWPAPVSAVATGTGSVIVDCNNFQFVQLETPSAIVAAAFDRFFARTFQHRCAQASSSGSTVPVLTTVYTTVVDHNVPLQLYVDESYTLVVNTTDATITANTAYGAMHALESLSQLIRFGFDARLYRIRPVPLEIVDAPRFPHRGVLLDTARHFEPLPTLYAIIDSLTYAKYNVLHWHIVDAESFPFDSPTYPQLARAGAFSPSERYSPEDIEDVVAFAAARGIRVMVELDTPGHSASFCAGMPEVCPTPQCRSKNVNNWALDITRNVTYEVMAGLLSDLAALFPEQLMHLGGDEVIYQCWQDRPYIMQWLAARNLTLTGGYLYYVSHVQAIARALNRTVVGWQEIWNHFGTALDKSTVIQQWLPNSITLPLNVTSHGYRLVWSDSSVWYLDNLKVTWPQMYVAEPCNGLPDANCELILGGEGCQWGETVDTSDALQTIWPRAAAIAERLWSPRNMTNATAATPRLANFRCLLNDRGIAAAPIDNLIARQAPPNPGSCYDQ